MIIAFQIILLFIVFVSFAGIISERNNKKSQDNFSFICAISIAAFIASVLWL
ncbi:hypothetical protein [Virgibacillus oceani]|uniref:hypothetical protein n=1 Tax=Virgibacillus oceani TaxID=1479511 RepID=UPI0016662B9B|nr:hypothetical protein [Virgibacillus oceani]